MQIFLLRGKGHFYACAKNRAAHARGKNPSKVPCVLISPPGPRTLEEVLCMKGELSPGTTRSSSCD